MDDNFRPNFPSPLTNKTEQVLVFVANGRHVNKLLVLEARRFRCLDNRLHGVHLEFVDLFAHLAIFEFEHFFEFGIVALMIKLRLILEFVKRNFAPGDTILGIFLRAEGQKRICRFRVCQST